MLEGVYLFAAPLLPLRAFNREPQSAGLGLTSRGAYAFPSNVARLLGGLRLVNQGFYQASLFRAGQLTVVKLLVSTQFFLSR